MVPPIHASFNGPQMYFAPRSQHWELAPVGGHTAFQGCGISLPRVCGGCESS